MSNPQRAYIGLGANLGEASATLLAACERIAALPHTRLVAASPLYVSAPVDAGGPDFTNAVAAVDTALAPMALLRALQAIESEFGRERPYRNAPRTLDLDVLLYGDVVSTDPVLTLPHPRLAERRFALQPLHDLAPEARLPSGERIAKLLASVQAQALAPLARDRIPPTWPSA